MLEDTASAHLLARYGYPAIILGTLLEGETVVLVAGFLAHQGHLSLPLIIICSICGSCLSDQGLFFLTRRKGGRIFKRFPKAEAEARALADRMRKRAWALPSFALVFRFFYGLRNIAPVFLGLSSLPAWQFVVLNFLGAVVWATAFACGGYFLAKGITSFTGTIRRYELVLVGALFLPGLFWFIRYRLRGRGKTETRPARAASGPHGAYPPGMAKDSVPPTDAKEK